jgi:hypothetical protein
MNLNDRAWSLLASGLCAGIRQGHVINGDTDSGWLCAQVRCSQSLHSSNRDSLRRNLRFQVGATRDRSQNLKVLAQRDSKRGRLLSLRPILLSLSDTF